MKKHSLLKLTQDGRDEEFLRSMFEQTNRIIFISLIDEIFPPTITSLS